MKASRVWVLVCLPIVGLCASIASAAVNIETVLVGNPGNAGELSGAGAGGYGPDRICGSASYTYSIGKYEVTADQYTQFLNSVAADDTYGLYNSYMDYDADPSRMGCNIKRDGAPGTYTYSVAPDWANRPVNYVSWGDAARFANWLSNGQPNSGVQDFTTTEDGSYYLNGATSDAALLAVTRNANATWVIPSEDEWYKAAYYDPAKPGGAGYWDYPTRSSVMPSNALSITGTNNANYYWAGYTIGAPYYRTEVGAFSNSASPYGTRDQAGNVREWTEALVSEGARGLRGWSFSYEDSFSHGDAMHAATRNDNHPTDASEGGVGFRLVQVPEPITMAILAFGGTAMLARQRGHLGVRRP